MLLFSLSILQALKWLHKQSNWNSSDGKVNALFDEIGEDWIYFFLLLVSEVEIHINLENKRGEWVMGIEWLVSRVLVSGWVADGCGWVCRCGWGSTCECPLRVSPCLACVSVRRLWALVCRTNLRSHIWDLVTELSSQSLLSSHSVSVGASHPHIDPWRLLILFTFLGLQSLQCLQWDTQAAGSVSLYRPECPRVVRPQPGRSPPVTVAAPLTERHHWSAGHHVTLTERHHWSAGHQVCWAT